MRKYLINSVNGASMVDGGSSQNGKQRVKPFLVCSGSEVETGACFGAKSTLPHLVGVTHTYD